MIFLAFFFVLLNLKKILIEVETKIFVDIFIDSPKLKKIVGVMILIHF